MAAIASTITNHVASKFGHIRPLFMASLVILPVGMGLMSTLDSSASIGKVVGYSLICGIGFGSVCSKFLCYLDRDSHSISVILGYTNISRYRSEWSRA